MGYKGELGVFIESIEFATAMGQGLMRHVKYEGDVPADSQVVASLDEQDEIVRGLGRPLAAKHARRLQPLPFVDHGTTGDPGHEESRIKGELKHRAARLSRRNALSGIVLDD